jgi:hypothetical protein
VFLKTHYPEVHLVDKLSERLVLSIERISVWFQNRRAKFKKAKKPASEPLIPHRNLTEFLDSIEPSKGNFETIKTKYLAQNLNLNLNKPQANPVEAKQGPASAVSYLNESHMKNDLSLMPSINKCNLYYYNCSNNPAL